MLQSDLAKNNDQGMRTRERAKKKNIEMFYSDSLEMNFLAFQDSSFLRRGNVKEHSELDN